MSKLIFSSLVLILFFSSCTKDSTMNSPNDTSKNGTLILKIDKENAPSNVITVTAKLTRSGFSTITSQMNILTDSTASLLMNNISIGTWNLTVEGLDIQNVVQYRGTTQVTVLENSVTNVSLVLNPVSSGVGSISILVSWNNGGITPTDWIDFINNPIVISLLNNNSYVLGQPAVVFDGAKYHMWFTEVYSGASTDIYYATSVDGLSWQRYSTIPVLTRGDSTSWDSRSVQPGAVMKDGQIFRMYYFGYSFPEGDWKIGLALSTNGINWTKLQEPVFSISGQRIAASAIIKVENTYYLYYTRFTPYGVYLATSSDGLSWTNFSNSAVITQTQNWETQGVYEGNVIYEDNLFKMVYMNVASNAFGFATSTDGKLWEKSSSNPIFTKANTVGNWANYQIAYPYLVRAGNELRIYYCGGSNYSSFQIGVTRKTQ